MGAGRLRLAVYLGGFVLLFVAGGLVLAIQSAKAIPSSDMRYWFGHTLERLVDQRQDRAYLQTELAELEAHRMEISLYTPQHELITSSVEPPLPLDENDDFTFVHEVLRDGKVVVVGVGHMRRPVLRHFLLPLVVLLCALIALVFVISRHIGRPLQRLADAARRFGRGELNARAAIQRSDELGDVGRAFDQMADRVTVLMTAQRELMANVSHELQTPLARMTVAVDLMLDGIDDRVKELLPEISQDLKELERLIDDVMMLSRFELADAQGGIVAAPLRCEPIVLAELVSRSVTRFKALHHARELVVETDAQGSVHVDPTMIGRVLDNILENARKYSDEHMPIEIRTSSEQGSVQFRVRDHGIGIDAADLTKMFTPFFRTDRSRTRTTGGVGLGLVLARRIVLAHGGQIALESVTGQGTDVTITLPVAPDLARRRTLTTDE